MDSLYRGHPVGGLLVWVTVTDGVEVRGNTPQVPGAIQLLLDGQQRITTLYGIIRGKAPKFFDGNSGTFTGLHFHIPTEEFSFYQPTRMRGDPLWVNVTELMQRGVFPTLQPLLSDSELQGQIETFGNRLNSLSSIKEKDFHIDQVTGDDKSIDIVVDIFNRVNSGGTKLSNGDLALAKISASWPDARDEMKARLNKWRHAGFNFNLDWFLRCINTIVTGNAQFAALRDVNVIEVQSALLRAEKAIDAILNLLSRSPRT